jgi:hypothetical protein
MKKIQIFIALLNLFFWQLLSAQSGTLSGKVLDYKGNRISYGIITILSGIDTISTTQADEMGKYNIPLLSSGVYDVKAETINSRITVTGVQIMPNQLQFLDITLPSPKNKQEDFMMITIYHFGYDKDPIQFRTISGQQFRQSALGRN